MFAGNIFYTNLNLPLRENLDLLIWQMLKLIGYQLPSFYYALQVMILFSGLVLLFLSLELSARNTVIAAVFCLTLALTLSGANVFLLKIHWLPWVMTFLLKTRDNIKLSLILTLVLFLGLFIVAAGALAPIGIIFIALGYLLLIHQELEVNTNKRGIRVNSFLLICAYVLSVYIMPVYNMPDYPGDARLSTVSPLTFRELPLVGAYLFPLPVFWAAYNNLILRDVFLYVLILTFTCFVVYGPARNRHLLLNRYFSVQVILLLIVLLESFTSAEYINLTPYYALYRIIPGLALQQMPSMLLLLGVIAFLPALILRWQCVINVGLLVPALLVMAISYFLPMFSLAKSVNFQFDDQFRAGRYPEAGASNYVVSRGGDWLLNKRLAKERAIENLKKLRQEIDYKVTVSSSVNQEQVVNLIDNNIKTIWRTGRRQQAGDIISLNFDSPISIVKVVLETKGAEQDFPRGLKVSFSEDGIHYQTILEQFDWQGGIRWTEAGLPYFTNQANISIDFPVREKVKTLRFEQIGSSDRFDWTVADISLYDFP